MFRQVRQHYFDRPGTVEKEPRENSTGDFLAGLAVVLSALAFCLGGFAALQAMGAKQDAETATGGAAPQQASIQPGGLQSSFKPGTVAPVAATQVNTSPSALTRPVFNRAGQIEILSVTPVPKTDSRPGQVVNVQMQLRRMNNRPVEGDSLIQPQDVLMINSRTNETYQPFSYQTSNDRLTSLNDLQPGDAVVTTLSFRVPQNLDRFNLAIPRTAEFRNLSLNNFQNNQ